MRIREPNGMHHEVERCYGHGCCDLAHKEAYQNKVLVPDIPPRKAVGSDTCYDQRKQC